MNPPDPAEGAQKSWLIHRSSIVREVFRSVLVSSMVLRKAFLWLILFCVICAGQPTYAQTPMAPKADATSPAADKPAAKPASPDVISLRNASGETVPLLRTPSVEEVLAGLKARALRQPQEPAPSSIASVALEGSVDGDQATLQATLKIQILVDNQWIPVPLKLTEGILQDQSHAGPGEATPLGTDPEEGFLWWLKGKGLHELKLSLIVPLRKELPSRRLQLTLPHTVVSSLKLRVPQPRLTAKGDETGRARLTLKPTSDGATFIEMIGLGPRLDLSWQPQPDLGTVDTVLEARTAITATIDGRTMLLQANQRLGALQGTFNQVQVRMPRGSELLKVDGEYFKERLVDPKDPTQVTVILKDDAPAGSPIDLKWTVRVDIPSQTERILIEGFEVAKAKIQTGHLAIRLVGDYRLERIESQNQFVQRDNLSTLEKAVPAFPIREDVSSAYSILRQPFQLAFNLQPEKPHITVTPRLFLSLNADRMELFGEYDIQVYRGGIEEVHFAWPGWKDEGWKLDPVAPPNQVEETKRDDPSDIRVKLIERKVGFEAGSNDRTATTTPKQFTLMLHATRMLSADQPEQEFTLPGMPGTNMSPADFVLVLADNLDADLRPLEETATRLQSVSASTTVLPPKDLRELRRRYYRLDAARAKFAVSTTVQKQRISTQTDVEVSLDGSELHLQQRIAYDVAYERLSQAMLLVPDQLLSHATFSVSHEADPTRFVSLAPIPTGGGEKDARKQLRLPLVPQRIGKFEIQVQVTLPVTWPVGSATAALDIPLAQPDNVENSLTRVRVQKPKRQGLKVAAEGWTPQAPQNGASVWLAAARQSSISVQCEKSDGQGQKGIAVPRRLIQAAYSAGGEVYCQAKFYIAGQASVLRVTFPVGSEKIAVKWGAEKLDAASYSRVPGPTEQYQITLPETAAAENEHLLSVAYQLPKQSRLDTGDQRRLAAPEILSDGTPTQTFWQILLPLNQHLWTLPAGFTPEFDWQRKGGWWVRVPRHTPDELEHWVSGKPKPAVSAMSMSANRYLFSSLEGSSEMTFYTLSAPLIVLIGSSLALLLGFVLVNVPSTRHVMTFLGLGFLTTVAALWYSEPVLVLLQPAGLGLLLALLASVAQRWFRKSRLQPVLTMTHPSDILTATSSREQAIPQAMLAEGSTLNQPPPLPVAEAGTNL
jgi:hypothetical protein